MPSVDFGWIKHNVTMWDILDHYQVKVRCQNVAKQQYVGHCPFPTHSGPARKESLSVFDKGWTCYSPSCGEHGRSHRSVIDFVMAMEGLNKPNLAAEKIMDWFSTKKESLPLTTEGPQKYKGDEPQSIKSPGRLQLVSSKKEDTSLIDWLEKSPAENISDGVGTGSQPVPQDSSAQAQPGQKGFMKSIDVWLDDLLVRKNESEAEFWHRVRNGIKKKLIENYRELRKEVARTA